MVFFRVHRYPPGNEKTYPTLENEISLTQKCLGWLDMLLPRRVSQVGIPWDSLLLQAAQTSTADRVGKPWFAIRFFGDHLFVLPWICQEPFAEFPTTGA